MNDLVGGAEGECRAGQPPLAWVWSQYRGEIPSQEGELKGASVVRSSGSQAKFGRPQGDRLGLAAAAIAAGMIAAGGLAWLYAENSERAAATTAIPGPAAASTGESVQIQANQSASSSQLDSTPKAENGTDAAPRMIKAASPAPTTSEAAASTTPAEGAGKGENSADAKAHVKPTKKKIKPKSKE